mgnify:CR=1 FL=1
MILVTAMNMIQSLNDNLTTTSSMTRESRISITSAKDQIAIASLRIVALYNKRLRLRVRKAVMPHRLNRKHSLFH